MHNQPSMGVGSRVQFLCRGLSVTSGFRSDGDLPHNARRSQRANEHETFSTGEMDGWNATGNAHEGRAQMISLGRGGGGRNGGGEMTVVEEGRLKDFRAGKAARHWQEALEAVE